MPDKREQLVRRHLEKTMDDTPKVLSARDFETVAGGLEDKKGNEHGKSWV
jgi:hypothetical protein